MWCLLTLCGHTYKHKDFVDIEYRECGRNIEENVEHNEYEISRLLSRNRGVQKIPGIPLYRKEFNVDGFYLVCVFCGVFNKRRQQTKKTEYSRVVRIVCLLFCCCIFSLCFFLPFSLFFFMYKSIIIISKKLFYLYSWLTYHSFKYQCLLQQRNPNKLE